MCAYTVCVVTSNIDPLCDETPSLQPLHHHSVGEGGSAQACVNAKHVCVAVRSRQLLEESCCLKKG